MYIYEYIYIYVSSSLNDTVFVFIDDEVLASVYSGVASVTGQT